MTGEVRNLRFRTLYTSNSMPDPRADQPDMLSDTKLHMPAPQITPEISSPIPHLYLAVLISMQNGFKPDARTTDNTFILNGIIEKYTALKRPLYICFVDFKSAFDHVNRQALLFKLTNQTLKEKCLKS